MNDAYRWAGGNGVGRAVNIGYPICKGCIQDARGSVRREWKFRPYLVLPNQMPGIHSLVSLPDFLWIFFVKVFLGSCTFIVGNVFITFLVNMALSEFKSGEEWLLIGRGIIRILLLAFALFGIFFQGKYEELTEINTFWYVACIIWGLSISFDSSGVIQPANQPPPC